MQACLEHDPDPGTRMAALCGLGLAGEDISSAIAQMARNDASGHTRMGRASRLQPSLRAAGDLGALIIENSVSLVSSTVRPKSE